MAKTEITDELILSAQKGDQTAYNLIIEQCKPIVGRFIKNKYYRLPGGERDDLFQEGLLGIYKAIRDYDPDKQDKGNFISFCRLCVERNLISAIKTATRKKHSALNDSQSYDKSLSDKSGSENDNMSVMDLVSGEGYVQDYISFEFQDPLKQLEISDILEQFEEFKEKNFSDSEKQVFELHQDDASYEEICSKLGINAKAVDNAVQRTKRKIQQFREMIEAGQKVQKPKTRPDYVPKKKEPLKELSNEELVAEYQKTKSKEIQEQLFEKNKRLVFEVLKQVKMVGNDPDVTRDDLIQAGNMGLIKAIEKFDLSRDVQFSTFAFTYIRGFIFNEWRIYRRSNSVFSHHVLEDFYKLKKAKRKLQQELGREPNEEDLAKELEMTLEDVRKLLEKEVIKHTFSLEHERLKKNNSKDDETVSLIDTISDPNTFDVSDLCNQMDISEALEYLNNYEKDVIEKRFFKEMTLEEVGNTYGVTKEAIRQIEMPALEKLKAILTNENLDVLLKKNLDELNYEVLHLLTLPLREKSKAFYELVNQHKEKMLQKRFRGLNRSRYITNYKWKNRLDSKLTDKGQRTLKCYYKAKGIRPDEINLNEGEKQMALNELTYRILEASSLPPKERDDRMQQLCDIYGKKKVNPFAGTLKQRGHLDYTEHYTKVTITEKGKEVLDKYKDEFGPYTPPENSIPSIVPEDDTLKILFMCSLSLHHHQRKELQKELFQKFGNKAMSDKLRYLKSKGYVEYGNRSYIDAFLTDKGREKLELQFETKEEAKVEVEIITEEVHEDAQADPSPVSSQKDYSNEEVLEIVRLALLKNDASSQLEGQLQEKDKEIDGLKSEIENLKSEIENMKTEKDKYKEKVLAMFALD